MNGLASNTVILPGIVALLLFLVFTYLYEQSRQPYFRAWQLGWGAYSLHFGLDAWNFRQPSAWVYLASSLLIVVMALCLFVSTRLMRERFRLRWYDVALAVAGVGLAIWSLHTHYVNGVFQDDLKTLPHVRLEIGIAALAALLLDAFLPLRAPPQFARVPHAGSRPRALGRPDGCRTTR